jgi:hypothetical protein
MGSHFICSFCKKEFYVERFVLMDANNNYYCLKCRKKKFQPFERKFKKFIDGLKREKKEEEK